MKGSKKALLFFISILIIIFGGIVFRMVYEENKSSKSNDATDKKEVLIVTDEAMDNRLQDESVEDEQSPLGDVSVEENIIIFDQVGGKPNDKTFDNSPVFERVLTNAKENSVIIFGQGDYEFKSPVTVNVKLSQISIMGLSVGRGENQGTQLYYSGENTFLIFSYEVDYLYLSTMLVVCKNNSFLKFNSRITNSKIEDLFIVNSVEGISIASYSNLELNNVSTILNNYSEYSLKVYPTFQSSGLSIVKCSFDGQDSSNGDAVVINGGKDISILNTDICNWNEGTGLKIEQKKDADRIDRFVMNGVNVIRCDGGIEISNLSTDTDIYADNISIIFRGKSKNEKGILVHNNQNIKFTLLALQTRILDSVTPKYVLESDEESLSDNSCIEISQNLSSGKAYIANKDTNINFVDRSFNTYQELKVNSNGMDKVYKIKIDSCSPYVDLPEGTVRVSQGNTIAKHSFTNTFCGDLFLEIEFDQIPAIGELNIILSLRRSVIDYTDVRRSINMNFPTRNNYVLFNKLADKKIPGVYRIEEFGGKSNDSTIDNGIAITEALRYMSDHAGILLFSEGTYFCSTPVLLTESMSSIQLIGDEKATFLDWSGEEYLFNFTKQIWWSRIDGFHVQCHNNSFVNNKDSFFKSYISHVTIRDCNVGLVFDGFTYAIIEDIEITTTSKEIMPRIIFGKAHNTVCEFIYMNNCRINGSMSDGEYGVLILRGSNMYFSNIHLTCIEKPICLKRDENAPMLSLIYFDSIIFDNCANGFIINNMNYIEQVFIKYCDAIHLRPKFRAIVLEGTLYKFVTLNVTNSFSSVEEFLSSSDIPNGNLHYSSYIQN